MTNEELKSSIQEAIQSFANGNLTDIGLQLFEKIGYSTERRAPLDKPTFQEFQDTYISDQRFDETKARIKEWKYVDLLFQLSKDEVSQQASLFDTKQVDKTIIETYLFFALELTGKEYNRTDLSNITREFNRLFPMPVMVLFKYGKKLTFSVINRRLHKRDESKDVLEKVTLIKDISIESPLRAHIEILFDLSFQELLNKHQFTNFVELHNAWQKTLDTKELNKRFYSELFNWYLWAVQSFRFPNDVNDDKDDNVYNAESVIRLLTRLIFVWFIKEKNLVPETLFNVKKLKTILKDLKPESEKTSVYYRAILQNLFFATLNTPMDKDITDENKDEKRRFINTLPKTGNDQYLDQTKYRYQDYFINPDKALELFATIPFLNGGLFECLDFKEGNKEIRFDGFSSTEKRQAFVPDKLFFAEEFVLDLNAEYGTKGKKYKVEGLINILDSYKFTIAENTPLEEEIALDPELLGKVFENLLASYNPETQTTARKQTGSFYTPREIVNYMVDESLIAYFKQKLDNSEDVETHLRDLFAHTTDLPEFSKAENTALIKAISEAKILDPACGSGAFPMGVLHRLVDLLNKLDPENKHWNELQKQRAIAETTEVFDSGDTEERKIRFEEINKAFDLSMNYPDYARKLFLIENCIYGVDIQQIAIQISKLRFFISLIVDQKVDDSKPNRNILSMPNLETKFVAANTLIGLDKPQQMTLMAGDVERLEKELATIRHKIFFTRKYSAKKALKKKEKDKREELQTALTQSGFSKNVAGQIAGWNPFDPMQSAKFFDPETMFGLTKQKNEGIGFTQSNEISLINKQIEAINKQVEALNLSLKLDQAHAIIKLKLVSTQLQVNIIEAELGNIQNNIEVLFGTIQPNVSSIVNEPIDVTYTINALNKSIAALNNNIKEISKDIKPVSQTKNEGVFDVVIGNPPYVEAKKLKDISQTLRKFYSTYSGTADLYVYFYENGVRLLKEKGTLVFITSNKFIKTSYGKNLRKYFTCFMINEIVDFTDVHVFEALVASCIFSISKNKIDNNKIKIAFANDTLTDFSGVTSFVEQNKFYLSQKGLNEKIWQLENETKLALKGKIENESILLNKTGSVKIFRGVTTGYNPAFIIDDEKRKELLMIDKANKSIIKPMLQGRNIRKWVYNKTSDFLIFTRKGIDINEFPSIKIHLNNFRQQLEPGIGRKPGSYNWYEIQDNTAYFPEFEKEKIIWGLTSDKWTFAFDNEKNYLPSNGYILTSTIIPIKYLLALLNSRLMEFYFGFIGIMTAGGAYTLKYETVIEFPIKNISSKNQQPFITLVDQILTAKKIDTKADTSALEKQIDELVYKLYELTDEEIAIIEGGSDGK